MWTPPAYRTPARGFSPAHFRASRMSLGFTRHNCRLRVFLHETNTPFRSVNGHVYRYQI